ncbi:alpha-L-rhamnosidase C-terminal domain-containing protein [Niabella terrae]
MQNRRTERGVFFPVFWKIDNHYPLIDFHRVFELSQPETVDIRVQGRFNVKLDGKAYEGAPQQILVPAGRHKINIKVFNQQEVPAIYVKGPTIQSDSSWLVTFEDKEWIDETGKTSDVSTTKWMQAGSWNFDDPNAVPSDFKLPVKPQQAVATERKANSTLVDFGRETFGFIKLHQLKGQGQLTIFYGESREEALDTAHTETFDRVAVDQASGDYTLNSSKAFRYINIVADPSVRFEKASMLYEYADLQDKGNFRCNDDEINRIYEVAKYTFHLCSREFFIDGIKRDRWIWSGDAYQSYLMNYYLTNDNATVKRTTLALRGKDPVTSHINTIMDYTLYWFLGVYDYYLYSGDTSFVKDNYDRMESLMSYVLGRRNKEGLLEGLPGDWVFIDWADGLSKQGAVSFEQILFARSLETMALVADLVGKEQDKEKYRSLAGEVKKLLFDRYWNASKKAFVHSLVNGHPTSNITRYTNMFAIFFDYLNAEQRNGIKDAVLLNDQVPPITTPYMRFYELEALCALGQQDYVTREMKAYWGGMLRLGATSFWEEYNPKKSGAEHYAMYGRRYGKSLCHAWGASPIYLLGKYYLGVKPVTAGYETYTIEPALGGLKWMEGKVPTPEGNIEIYCSTREMKVLSPVGTGTLILKSRKAPKSAQGKFIDKGEGRWELKIEAGRTYQISYQAT